MRGGRSAAPCWARRFARQSALHTAAPLFLFALTSPMGHLGLDFKAANNGAAVWRPGDDGTRRRLRPLPTDVRCRLHDAPVALHQQAWLRAAAPAQPAGPDLRLGKAGIPAALARLLAASKEELAGMQSVPPDWASKRLEAYKSGGSPPEPPPPFCTIMLNDEYKVIFLKCTPTRPIACQACITRPSCLRTGTYSPTLPHPHTESTGAPRPPLQHFSKATSKNAACRRCALELLLTYLSPSALGSLQCLREDLVPCLHCISPLAATCVPAARESLLPGVAQHPRPHARGVVASKVHFLACCLLRASPGCCHRRVPCTPPSHPPPNPFPTLNSSGASTQCSASAGKLIAVGCAPGLVLPLLQPAFLHAPVYPPTRPRSHPSTSSQQKHALKSC